jgi:dihydrofolate reductase
VDAALPTVSVYIAVSLDGCIARSDGRIDWLDSMQIPGEDYGYAAFMAAVDTIVIGRATYEQVLAFPAWPFAGRRAVVLTHRALEAHHGEAAHAGPLRPLLRSLADDGARRVYLDGGQAIRQGLREDVVDELTLSTVPLVLGDGRPLFERELPASQWALVSSRAFRTGLVQSHYARLRA